MGMNAARERVRVALALGKLPKIDARFATGALSYSKVRAMNRIANESNEDYLLMIAKHGTAYHVEKLVIKGRFPAEQGALIVKAIEMAMEKQYVAASTEMDRAHGALLQDGADVYPKGTWSAETSRRIACD
jgi:hypothetical protein